MRVSWVTITSQYHSRKQRSPRQIKLKRFSQSLSIVEAQAPRQQTIRIQVGMFGFPMMSISTREQINTSVLVP
jgi:hypothetical protein